MAVRTKNGRHIVEFELRGHRVHRRLPQGTTREQAQELESRLRAAIFGQIDLGRKPTILISAAMQAWIDERVKPMKAYRSTLNHSNQLDDWIADKTLADIPDVADRYKKRQTGTLANATINRRLCVLKAVAKFAYSKGWIDTNLSARIQTLPEGPGRENYLTRQQIAKLVSKCSKPEGKAWIMIAAYTGMRQGEIMALQPRDITDVIRIRNSKVGTPRLIPIVGKLKPYLKHIPFTLHARTYYAMFEEARDAAGLKGLTFHDLRHTTASLLINEGVDLYTVGKILGHKNAATTKRYAHLSVETLTQAMKKIG